MIKTTRSKNKTLVLQAFDMLFKKRDYKAAASKNLQRRTTFATPSKNSSPSAR
jgi:hypothetical protein